MDTIYSTLIIQERAKLELLLEKVNACRKRIDALELLSKGQDGIDDALDSMLVQTNEAFPNSIKANSPILPSQSSLLNPAAPSRKKYTRKNSIAPQILDFLANGVKSVEDIYNYALSFKANLPRGVLRTLLWNMKNNGLLDSPKQGFYELSLSGIENKAFNDAVNANASMPRE